MTRLSKTCWIVVADEEKALLLDNRGTGLAPVLHLLKRIDSADVLAQSDRSARDRDHSQQTTEPADYHRMAGQSLATAVAAHLEQARAEHGFEQLVLIAPPQVLGALRHALPESLRDEVLAEMPKTLTGHPLPHIAELLAEALANT